MKNTPINPVKAIRIAVIIGLISIGAIFLSRSFARSHRTTPPPASVASVCPTPKPHPSGYYYLLSTPNSTTDITSSASNTNLDGWRIRLTWKDIQPDTTGNAVTDSTTYNWQGLDDLITAAGSKGVGISISAGIVCPNWVYAASGPSGSMPAAYKFNLDPSVGSVNEDVAGPPPYSEPVPWDQNFQAKWQTFVQAFGARYDGNPNVRYVLLTGFMQLVNANLGGNVDGSDTFTDGASTGSTSFQSSSGQCTFVNAAMPVGDIGRTLFAPTTHGNSGSTIVSVTSAHAVVLSAVTDNNGGGNQNHLTFSIYGRHPGMGDDYHFNNLAKNGTDNGTGSWTVFSDVDPVTMNTGYAHFAAYLDAGMKISEYFFSAFPTTPCLISPAYPFLPTSGNTYAADTNNTIRNYVQDNGNGGTCYTNLQAICGTTCSGGGPDYPARVPATYTNVKQAIHASSQTSQLYASPTPAMTPAAPQPLIDLLESGYSKGAQVLELYSGDLNSTNMGAITAITNERTKLLAAPTVTPTPVPLTKVESTLTHGTAGTYSVDLTSGTGIECRNGGSSGAYKIVFTFTNNLTRVRCVSATNGTISSSLIGPSPNQYTVNLTGVTNAQYDTVTLSNVSDASGNYSVGVSKTWGFLIGDIDSNGVVNATDRTTLQGSSNPVTSSNFRNDLNIDGSLGGADLVIVNSKIGTSL